MAENTTSSERRGPPVHQGAGSLQLPGWAIPVIAIVVAVAAAFVIERLNEIVTENREALLHYESMEEDMGRLNGAILNAIVEGGSHPRDR